MWGGRDGKAADELQLAGHGETWDGGGEAALIEQSRAWMSSGSSSSDSVQQNSHLAHKPTRHSC